MKATSKVQEGYSIAGWRAKRLNVKKVALVLEKQ